MRWSGALAVAIVLVLGAAVIPLVASTHALARRVAAARDDLISDAVAPATTFALTPPPTPRPLTVQTARRRRRHAARAALQSAKRRPMPTIVQPRPVRRRSRPRPQTVSRPRPQRPPPAARPRPAPIVATVLAGRGLPIPRSFFGLSVEYWDIPTLDAHPATLLRLLRLLTVSGDGPFVLRVGGDSADHTLWEATPHRGDPQSYVLSPTWFDELAAIAQGARLRLLLDLNLAARAPGMAAAMASEAAATMPRHAIEAFEIGNEPDLYHQEDNYRLATLADIRPATPGVWDHYSANRYAAAFRHYADAVAQAHVGRYALAGPEVANPGHDLRYVRALLRVDRSRLALITAHRYPYSACAAPGSPDWPTIARVLSPAASSGLADSLQPVVQVSAKAGLPVRLTEVDSVTCGGVPGVSNTFATALWAPDALFSVLSAGVAGVNVHVRQQTFNEAFAMTPRGLEPRPLLYGLLAFARTLDSARALLPAIVSAPTRDNLRVWAVRTTGGYIHAIALDKGGRTVHLHLELPTTKTAVVEWLTAPRLRSTSGVTLAGQHVNEAGRWAGPLVTHRLVPGPGGYTLTLPAHSAALLNVKE